MKTSPIFTALILISALSCSMSYENAVRESLADNIPTSQLYNVKRVQIQGGVPKITFEAEKGIIWKEREETELFSFEFHEYDSQQKALSKGKADYLLIKDNHDARIKGNVEGYSSRGEASVRTDALSWEDKSRILKGDRTNQVRIEKDDGSLLEGQGFSANLYTNTVTFSEGIHGRFESGNTEEAAP